MFKRLLLALLLSLAALRGQAALPFGLPADPLDPVTDQVGLLSAGEVQRLNQSLRAVWKSGAGPQVAVLIVKNLGGRPIEDQSLAVARGWALGDRDRDDGVLLLIARDDRQLRIEVGTKFEGQLTDIVSHRIIADVMVPRLRQGDAGGAVSAGVAHILSHVAPEAGQSALALPDSASNVGSRQVRQLSGAEIGMLLVVIALMVVAQMMGFPVISILLQILLSSGGRGGGGSSGSGGFGGGGGGFSGGGSSGRW